MKIAFATANLDIHGVATFTLNLSQGLQTAGHTVTVITMTRGTWWARLAELGIKGECIPQQPWDSVASHVKRLAAWLTEQSFDLLVVNVGSTNSRPLQLCLHLLPDPLPVVIILHNDDLAVYQIAESNCAAWNCAVGVSPKVQQVAQTRFPQKVIYPIRYGIALPSAAQLRERADWATPLRLLFVGRLEDRQKSILRLPVIVADCRRQGLAVQLTVIGDGPDREQLAQLCEATGVTDLVELVGFQSSEVVFAQMRAHHLFLLSSNYEGLPIVVLEAQANGCVPISARLAGITDVMITEGVTGKLVEPTDLDGYVEAIRSFLLPAHWHACSQAGIDYAQHYYSIPQMTEQYIALFDTLGQGAHPLTVPRSQLRRQGITPLRHLDALPRPLRRGLQRVLRRGK